ncbi:xanthine dehydrogenase family protein molybdopterin-binding subunit [Sphingomonas prati]|uniref:peptidylprolyl isomerase n=1 Tax=Sphingomonas prati TaxID=1843237 RepID=A0A7W9F4K4_9SPHN|nr:molybdopterin cofactor-binding domain-containing protein [Sphingomonas prati]MBB5730550.1 isoquinoline 1-oxidoreductase beta subunit [Sphingomonas prati]GGE94886.1 aldehyde oxidase [Sphingomonas prati]
MDDRISRRNLLVTGGIGAGLLIGWGLWPRSYRHNLVAAPGETIFDGFVKIGEDGHVAVVVPQAEMGQGVWTALPQMLADELGADWRTVSVEPAPINPLYANDFVMDEAARNAAPHALTGFAGTVGRELARRSAFQLTGGSSSVRGFEARYRAAGAGARILLCMAAARRWGIDWQACDTKDGFVVRGADRLRFAELAAEAAGLTLPRTLVLRTPGAGGVSGRSVPRLDLPAKVDGSIRYAGDLRLPGMLYASVRGAPAGGSRLRGVTLAAGERVPGVKAVIQNAHWVAVVATNWWAANRGLDAIDPQFGSDGPVPDGASVDRALTAALASGEGERIAAVGDLEEVFTGANLLTAEFVVPFAAHAPMETLTATARVTGDRLEVWMPTQALTASRDAVARATGFSAGNVVIYPMPIGGGFGRKVDNDAAVQAALIAIEVKRPVQLVWSREEETMRSRNRPPARAFLAARPGAGGTIRGWHARIAAPSSGREVAARITPRLAGGEQGAEPAAVAGAVPPYAIPVLAVDHLPVAVGIETGMWRSVAHSYTAFFTESFIDMLAVQAGVDPFSYRIAMLGGQPRLARCLSTATALGGWEGGGAGSGQGIAIHSSFGSHVAMVAQVAVEGGRVRVDRITAVVDAGRLIHPDTVRAQIEGGIVWGLAAALGGALDYVAGVPEQRNFDGLALPLLATTPEIVVELIASGAAPGGVGEIAVPPVAPAIANAIATLGYRRRTLPLRV